MIAGHVGTESQHKELLKYGKVSSCDGYDSFKWPIGMWAVGQMIYLDMFTQILGSLK